MWKKPPRKVIRHHSAVLDDLFLDLYLEIPGYRQESVQLFFCMAVEVSDESKFSFHVYYLSYQYPFFSP
ncbi:MAG: hypothetical protein ACFFD8_07660 [Candidatus Thorarchaeota archaeon]